MENSGWDDFEAAARRPIEQHIHNSFIHTYKPSGVTQNRP